MSDWITDSQDEQSLEELFRDADQIHVPVFQRAYVWKNKEYNELSHDIRQIREGVESSQFLGAVVAYERPRITEVVGRIRALSIVDGQQRLLTLYTYVMAIVELLASVDQTDAFEASQEFLLLSPRRGLDITTRVVPALADRSQFRVLWDRLKSPNVLAEQLGNDVATPPPPSGAPTGHLVQQYNRILAGLRQDAPDDPDAKRLFLRETLEIVTQKLTFVHLRLTDASAATKIFERLNFRGVRVGIVDLVRNEVFSRVAESPGEAQRLFDSTWKPFEDAFRGESEAFFFPYCLVHDSNTKKSDLFSHLRSVWDDLRPEEVVDHMTPFQGPFLAVAVTTDAAPTPNIRDRLDRLHRLKRPSAIFPFVMRLLREHTLGRVTESQCIAMLEGIESFLVRRAIVGYEPTGLHALFKGLWEEIGELSGSGLARVVSTKPTIQWPTDVEVQNAIRTRPLAKSKITPFLLAEFDRHLPGDDPLNEPTIEHILPQSLTADGPWASDFTREQHKELKDTLANLIPLSSPLNSSVQASAYANKRHRYQLESMFVTPRTVAQEYERWTPAEILARADILCEWAISRWPNFMS